MLCARRSVCFRRNSIYPVANSKEMLERTKSLVRRECKIKIFMCTIILWPSYKVYDGQNTTQNNDYLTRYRVGNKRSREISHISCINPISREPKQCGKHSVHSTVVYNRVSAKLEQGDYFGAVVDSRAALRLLLEGETMLIARNRWRLARAIFTVKKIFAMAPLQSIVLAKIITHRSQTGGIWMFQHWPLDRILAAAAEE